MANPHTLGRKKKNRIFAELYTRYAGKCHWCDMDVDPINRNERVGGTIDHLKTVNQGRKTYRDGGHVLACKGCNGNRNRAEIAEINTLKKGLYIKLDFDGEPKVVKTVDIIELCAIMFNVASKDNKCSTGTPLLSLRI